MKYIGITIGPIYNTIREAASPVALWFASNTFSDISGRLCGKIHKSFKNIKMIMPYYDDSIVQDDGVGKFPDRIIFRTECMESGLLKETLDSLIAQVKKDTLTMLTENFTTNDEEFIRRYIQIQYVILESDVEKQAEVIDKISRYLGYMERMEVFPVDSSNDIFKKLFGKLNANDRNSNIKNSLLYKKIKPERNQLIEGSKKEKLRTIDSIATNFGRMDANMKKNNYYAIVHSDGDHVTEYIKNLENEEQVDEFSKGYLAFRNEVSQKVKDFGGMTIYAGGDDLLFLTPLEDMQGKTIFDLCQEILKLYRKKLKQSDQVSMSFAISIQYHKYPLYEAMEESRNILEEICKKSNETRNSVAVELIKHSGTTMAIRISNDLCYFVQEILAQNRIEGKYGISDVIGTILNNKKLISIADHMAEIGDISKEEYITIIANLFDDKEQQKHEKFQKEIFEKYYKEILRGDHKKIDLFSWGEKKSHDKYDKIDVLLCVLEIKKFFTERIER